MTIVVVLAAVVAVLVVVSLAWRWASRNWSLPCPSLLAWMLESSLLERLNGTATTVERLELKPGQTILEIGPGPGRLLIPAAKRIGPQGRAIGVDIQPKMIDRLRRRAERAGLTNLTTIVGDATTSHVPPESVDVVFLCTVLGEIPVRSAALAECFKAAKTGGALCVTEMMGDPHYQSRSTVRRLAEQAGFRFERCEGSWLMFTSRFVKP